MNDQTNNDTTPDTTEDKLPELRDEVVELDASVVARVFTVAALAGWGPDVDNPFDAIAGTVKVDARVVGQAYIVAIANGWQPEPDDPLFRLIEAKGLLKIDNAAEGDD